MFFLDPLNGGAWPLLVGGVICLVDSFNGRDPSCPVGTRIVQKTAIFCAASAAGSYLQLVSSLQDSPFSRGEILGNSRSVMLLNVLGDTRTTMSVRTRNPTFWSDPLDSKEGGNTGITSTHLGPSIAIIGRATRNVS